ncbi:MAG: pectic acid lyase, partial [Planctomycetes bacterium]|nr:pectic acid lyase [Planctomycetota bacterium]
ARLDAIEAEYQRLVRGDRQPPPPPPSAAGLETEVRRIIAELDDRGRWVSTFRDQRLPGDQKFRPGDRYIGSDVFSANLETLSNYVQATRLAQ